jgi:arabinofuranan 3-O-arabinosyltransferase
MNTGRAEPDAGALSVAGTSLVRPATAEVAGPQRAGGPAQRIPASRWVLVVWLVVLLVLLANDPGKIFYDTKLGVDLDAAGFYLRLWHLWNPLEWFGTLQDQYIGYAFPMTPFYLLAQVSRVPVWIAERLWLSLLVAAGFCGLVRLAAALRIGSDSSRLAAGLAFALWPTFTIVIGSTSAAILPGMLAPWAVLPLVTAARRGPVLTAAARSGVAVLFMGGVNAVNTLDALLLPALFILTQARGRRRVVLGASWAAAVALAASWWAVPLLLQSRYSFNFLPYIEQAATTTRTMSAAAFLRGSGNWTAYFNLGQPWIAAGWMMIATPATVLASAAAAAGGLYGLAHREMPRRGWLRLSAGLAALGALAGYWGPLGGPFHAQVDGLLNGTLAPFRNVYKLEPVIAAVLALGLAHALSGATAPGTGQPRWQLRQLVPFTTTTAAVVVLAGLAAPYWTGQILNAGPFTNVPGYWRQVAAFLAGRSPREPAMVVPADAHGTYLWGDPIDDPLEPLARSPWVERGLVPYGSAGSQLFLETAETAIESGEQVAGLPGYLARAGIRYLVVRNDLSPRAVGYTPPQVVHQTLRLSGFHRVAAFGPLVTGAQTDPGAAPAVQSVQPAYPSAEVYTAAAMLRAGPASVSPVSRTVLVDGGPDSLLQLAGQGTLGGRPAVLAGDRLTARPQLWAVTDGLRRADNAFGLVTSGVSYPYTAREVNPPDDQLGAGGAPPRQILPVPGRFQTVAVLSGAASVTASSVGSWLAETPQYDPVNAFDRDPATSWAEGVPGSPVGQWLQVSFGHPVNLPRSAAIRLLDDGPARELADRVLVATAAGRAVTSLRPAGSVQPLRLPPGRTAWLRITIEAARRVTPSGPGAGIRDVLIPGLTVRSYLQPAEAGTGRLARAQVFSFSQQLPSPGLLADAAAYPVLARTFVTSGQRRFRVAASAVALPGHALDSLLSHLARPGRRSLSVSASSTLGSLPRLSPANLFSPRNPGPWIAGSAHPVLRVRWHGERRIGLLRLTPAYGFAAAPESVRVASPAGVRTATVAAGGLVTLTPPLRTDRVAISFPKLQPTGPGGSVAGVADASSATAYPGLARLQIPALAGLHAAVPDPASSFRLRCGQGPAITVDGHSYPTSVGGQVADLVAFRPVAVRLCTRGGVLRLPAARHWLVAAPPRPFAVTGMSLAAGLPAPPDGGGSRPLRVVRWSPESRVLRIGPGAASYLELHQNANPGWIATLDGRPLAAVRLDGWQQGYLVPAGHGGVIALTFAPAALYRLWLVIAAAGVAVLVLVALAGGRLGRLAGGWLGRVAGLRAGRPGGAWSEQSVAPVPSRQAPASHPAPGPAPGRDPVPAWAGFLLAGVLMIAISGPMALVVPVLAVLARTRPQWLPPLAAVAMFTAGVIAATAANPAATGSGAFSAAAQAAALLALAAALLPAISSGTGTGGPGDP